MFVDYLKRGVSAGAFAGVLYGLYLAVVANPLTGYMEGLTASNHGGGHDHGGGHGGEHDHGGGHGHTHGEGAEHLVSETTTAVVSVGSGVLWAILLGALFAVALYLFEPALPGSDAVRAAVLAAAGFFTVSVAPWLALPPAAPGVEQAYTPGTRLAIYAGLMVVGALVAASAVLVHRRVSAAKGPVTGAAVGVCIVLAASLTIFLASPTIVSVGEMPGDLVAAYQALAVLSQATLWAVIAGTYAVLHRRAANRPTVEERILDEPSGPASA